MKLTILILNELNKNFLEIKIYILFAIILNNFF